MVVQTVAIGAPFGASLTVVVMRRSPGSPGSPACISVSVGIRISISVGVGIRISIWLRTWLWVCSDSHEDSSPTKQGEQKDKLGLHFDLAQVRVFTEERGRSSSSS